MRLNGTPRTYSWERRKATITRVSITFLARNEYMNTLVHNADQNQVD